MRQGLDVFLVHLNPARLVWPRDGVSGAVWPGVLLVLAWAAAAVVAVRGCACGRSSRSTWCSPVALLLGLFSIASIFGFVWYYLMLWAWIINGLLIFATVWADRRPWSAPARIRRRGRAIARRRRDDRVRGHRRRVPHRIRDRRVDRRAADAAGVDRTRQARRARRSARSTAGPCPGGGRAGRYQVTIVDTMSINAPGYGLVSELERAGIHAGFPPIFSAIVRPKRIVTKDEATAVIHYASGKDIAVWRAKPDAVEVAQRRPAHPGRAA